VKRFPFKLCAALALSRWLRMDGTLQTLSRLASAPHDVTASALAREHRRPDVRPVPGPFLDIVGLTKRYRDQVALADVGFAMGSGEVVGIIGPNGAGKTTLLETIAGVLPADAGEVAWRGAPLPQPHRRKVIFYLPDGIRPYDQQPVARVLKFFAG